MDQIMEEARLCQEKLEELKMAAVQVAITLVIITNIIILTIKLMTRMIVTKENPSICNSIYQAQKNICILQAQRVGDIPRLQGLSQQVELCHAKQQDLLRERDDHQRLLRFDLVHILLLLQKYPLQNMLENCMLGVFSSPIVKPPSFTIEQHSPLFNHFSNHRTSIAWLYIFGKE